VLDTKDLVMTTQQPASARLGRAPIQAAALLVGATFLLVGILGFIPGITTDYSDMTFAGHESGAQLLGVFEVSVLHNIVHLLFGIAGLALARTARTSLLYLVGGGAIYLVLWVYGLVIDHESGANFVPLDDADNWLHLVLGAGMIATGLFLKPQHQPGAAPPLADMGDTP
jgi:hypothetical protein